MFISSLQEDNSEINNDNSSFIDLDEIMGDIVPCMQSPECTDHTPPPYIH